MEDVLSIERWAAEQDRRISAAVQREQGRLRTFVRQHLSDEGEVEDILQEVFYELVEAYRLMKPVEQVGAWLYRVARNRIIDFFRKKKPEALGNGPAGNPNGENTLLLEDLLPSPAAGPEAAYARRVLLEELEAALEELPEAQRAVFIAHELDGRSFQELADESGLSVNTLLSRKRYAVLHLRRRLQAIYDDFIST
ncbi:MAG TPA: sigma-70 family RNA polymerase sigma factor [Candidatus Binatia bacterium]|nr:sigma-70 family RNA polymerase sigma factor [Candidatus Binatia bacterium]